MSHLLLVVIMAAGLFTTLLGALTAVLMSLVAVRHARKKRQG
jgi:hypothetical protein